MFGTKNEALDNQIGGRQGGRQVSSAPPGCSPIAQLELYSTIQACFAIAIICRSGIF